MSSVNDNPNNSGRYLSVLYDLMDTLDFLGETAVAYQHLALEATSSIIPTRGGSAGTIVENQMRCCAAYGAGSQIMLERCAWIDRIPAAESYHEVLSAAQLAALLTSRSGPFIQVPEPENEQGQFLLGIKRLNARDAVWICVELSGTNLLPLPGDVMQVFMAILKLNCRKHQLVLQAEALLERNQALEKLLQLTTRLGENTSSLRNYMRQLLETALMVITDADYGSASILDGQNWKFICAIGHNGDELSTLELKTSGAHKTASFVVVDNLLDQLSIDMPEEIRAQFAQLLLPTKSSLVIVLPVNDDMSIYLSLDIALNSDRAFNSDSYLPFESFAQLATSYLKLRVHADVMRRAYQKFATKLALVAEMHDADTSEHNHRVGELSAFLAQHLGYSDELVDEIRSSARLHDIGKIFIDRQLIKNKRDLTPEEYEEIKKHTLMAGDLLDDPVFEIARSIALNHHERFDGSGYPRGLVGDAIPFVAQIVGIADVYDALRSSRSYKEAYSRSRVETILRNGGERLPKGIFNPRILDVLLEHQESIEELFYIKP